ncbi:MAG: hypothetical protein ACD_20C00431G0011 [uncultured bacterium]|nr:MAG: hypothetical protein ACD_20C00431G0011 [uncultured bacterium]
MNRNEKNMPEIVMPKTPTLELLKDQKALVTGGESGIGKSIAIALGQADISTEF